MCVYHENSIKLAFKKPEWRTVIALCRRHVAAVAPLPVSDERVFKTMVVQNFCVRLI